MPDGIHLAGGAGELAKTGVGPKLLLVAGLIHKNGDDVEAVQATRLRAGFLQGAWSPAPRRLALATLLHRSPK